ncbi:MAG: family ATPase [Actinomycetia bacterium]|nr:family ATPase [Actinomycetes bacterium]
MTDLRGANTRTTDFIGRAQELRRFEGALAAARAGTPCAFVVIGEAGVGKSRLTREWANHARASDARVLIGNCVQLSETAVPYAPVVEVLRGFAREIGADAVRDLLGAGYASVGGLLPELGDEPAGGVATDTAEVPEAAWGQGRLFEAVLTLLVRSSATNPVVLLIEDLHWADRATLDLLNFVVRNLVGAGVVVVGTERAEVARGAPVRAWTAEILRAPIVERVDVARFGRSEIVALLTAILGSAPDVRLADEIYRRSEGNAFFAEELLAAARGPTPKQLPATLRDTLLARVDALHPATVRVLHTLAVGGGRVPHALLSRVEVDGNGPTATADLLTALDEAVTQHVIVVENDEYAFRHATFTEALYASLLPGERMRLHAAFARALDGAAGADLAASAADRASHWFAAGDVARALPATIEAARLAGAHHAPGAATQLWERVLNLWEQAPAGETPPDVDLLEVRLHAADAANQSGAPGRAIEIVAAASALVDPIAQPHLAGRLQERLGWYRGRHGDEAGALAAYERALELIPTEPPSRERALALSASGRALTRRRDIERARPRCEEAVANAVAAGARLEEGMARHSLALALAVAGEPEAALTELLAATSIALEAGDIVELAWACLHLSSVGAQASRLGEAVTAISDLAASARRLGLERVVAGLLECLAAGGLIDLGRYEEAEALLAGVVARGPAGLEVVALHIARGTLAVRRGDCAAADDDLRAAQALTLGLRDGRINGLVFDGLAELARMEGRLDDARQTVLDGLDAVAHTGDDDMIARLCLTGVRVEADRAEQRRSTSASAAVDDLWADVQRLLATAEDAVPGASTRTRAAAAESSVMNARAEAARIEGTATPAMWEVVTAAWEQLGSPHQGAAARWRLAEALFAAGRRDDAARELRTAYEAAVALAAAPLVAGMEELGRRALVSLAPNAAAPNGGAEEPVASGLTPRELEVLRLVAAGRTNRQVGETLFMSEKTASVHVSRILAKLGVASRGEAAALAHLRGWTATPPS